MKVLSFSDRQANYSAVGYFRRKVTRHIKTPPYSLERRGRRTWRRPPPASCVLSPPCEHSYSVNSLKVATTPSTTTTDHGTPQPRGQVARMAGTEPAEVTIPLGEASSTSLSPKPYAPAVECRRHTLSTMPRYSHRRTPAITRAAPRTPRPSPRWRSGARSSRRRATTTLAFPYRTGTVRRRHGSSGSSHSISPYRRGAGHLHRSRRMRVASDQGFAEA